jgi:hypothetical protein
MSERSRTDYLLMCVEIRPASNANLTQHPCGRDVQCLGMPAELEAVDRLLDDPVFFEPFRVHFHAVLGRPSNLFRLMFLKYRYRFGFEPLCGEVTDSISWQRSCGIPRTFGIRAGHLSTKLSHSSQRVRRRQPRGAQRRQETSHRPDDECGGKPTGPGQHGDDH